MLKNQKNKQSKLYGLTWGLYWSSYLYSFALGVLPKSKGDESDSSLDSYTLGLGSMPNPHTVNLIVC